jgi:hypothetical protein
MYTPYVTTAPLLPLFSEIFADPMYHPPHIGHYSLQPCAFILMGLILHGLDREGPEGLVGQQDATQHARNS